MAASATTTTPSYSLTSSLPIRARLIHQSPPFLLLLSPNQKPPNPLTLTLSLPLPHLRLLRPAAASDDLISAFGDEEAEEEVTDSELSGTEADQLLEQEHEEEQAEEKKKAASEGDGRLYVGNLPYSITSSQLSEIFAEAGGVRSVEIMYDRVTDRSRGFAFVTMESVEDAEKAIQMFDNSQIGGRSVKVNFPEVPRGGERKVLEPKIKSAYQNFVETPHKVYAGNLSWSLNSQGLRDAFSDQPGFLSAKVIYERETGKSRGFGFISFSSAEEARSAIEAMNGVEREGRPLRLNMAAERPRASPSSEEPVESSSEEPVEPSSEEPVEPSSEEPVQSSSEESVEESEILSGVSS